MTRLKCPSTFITINGSTVSQTSTNDDNDDDNVTLSASPQSSNHFNSSYKSLQFKYNSVLIVISQRGAKNFVVFRH